MLKVIELFAGIGSQHQALKNIKVEHEIVAISEIDKFCIQSYEALHGKVLNLGDICKIDELPKADLWTYSFPCQDISVAGKLAGIKDGTRSGLLYQVERLLLKAKETNTLPKYLLLENVKNLVSKRFRANFEEWLRFLSELGYDNKWQVLNAKDYGIPQNRERVFCVSIRGEHDPFYFPPKQELKLKLKDLLEEQVDEKYYLSQKMINCFMSDGTGRYPRRERFLSNIGRENQDVGNSVTTLAGNRPTDNFVVEASGKNLKEILCDKLIEEGLVKEGDVVRHSFSNARLKDLERRVENTENSTISPTLTTRPDTLGVVVGIPIKNATKKGYLIAEEGDGVDISGRMEYHRGTVQKGITQTITTAGGTNVGVVVENLRIRKLTPRECYRLMGWSDIEIDKIQATGLSSAQQYKQAGNGIVVQVLEAIFKNLFKGAEDD